MLYFKVSKTVEGLTPEEIKLGMEEVRSMGIVADNTHDAMRQFMVKALGLLTSENVRTGLSYDFGVVLDDEDNIIYRKMTVLVKGYATDTEGRTVIFTDAGAITIVLD